MRIILFIKTAVSINDSLDHGHQALADLCHGVPVEGAHHLRYLLDDILGFVTRLLVGSLKMNTALEYSTRVVQEGDRRCEKSTLNDLAYLTPIRIPLMNPVFVMAHTADSPHIK